MSMNAQWVWMNGEFRRWNDALVHVSAHALHYGTGVFEGVRCYATADGPALFRMDAHLERLFASAWTYGMKIPYSPEELAEATCELIRRNHFEDCYVRPLVYRGSGGLGLNPERLPVRVAILAWPWELLHGAASANQGVRVCVSRWKKFHSEMMPTTAKACGQYLNSILAVRDAVERGFDEALLLDVNGCLAEAAGENLFVARQGELWTNDERHSILLGVTRDSVIQIAQALGCQVRVRPLAVEDLLAADEAFLTGTAAEIVPIREVDGAAIGAPDSRPLTQSIQREFRSAAGGQNQRYHHWLWRVAAGTPAALAARS